MDKAREWTDEKLEQMEKEISDIYSEAQSDLTKKWNEYMERGKKCLSALYKKAQDEIEDNKINGANNDKAQKAYESAVRDYTVKNDDYKAMVNATTNKLARTNEIALAYSNDQLPDIYTKNWAQVGEDLEGIDLSFTEDNGKTIKKIVSEDAVKRMIKTGDVTTPFMRSPKYLNIPKDKRWNTKQINSSVLQGILQGESMQDIAKRLLPIVDRNASAAIRNARTLVTGAENSGRNDSYDRLGKEGIVMKKVWLATGDERTRSWHLDMDGQEVDPDESFTDGNGNKLKYPGDPSAAAETVYNCRCSMKTHIIGFRRADGSISYVDFEDDEESLHEREIREERERRSSLNKNENKYVLELGKKQLDEYTQNELEQLRKKYTDEIGLINSPQHLYDMAEEFTRSIANENNFFMNSVGFWEESKAPKRDPDHISYNRKTGKISSRYWYTEQGVYRKSDHWGSDVASCSWYIQGRTYSMEGIQKGKTETGFIEWKKLKAKGAIARNFSTKQYSLTGFNFKK